MTKLVVDIMSRQLTVLEEWENLLDVSRDMARGQLRHLPVVDGQKLVGLISHRDLLSFTASRLMQTAVDQARDSQLKASTFVATVMTRDVQTVLPSTPVAEAAAILAHSRFGCLPVIEPDGTLVGIVSEHDMVRLLLTLLA